MKVNIFIFVLLPLFLFAESTYDIAKEAEKKKDYATAEKLYKESCNSGDDKSCLGLTNLYFNGKGKYGNMTVAFKLSKMLCNKDNAEGCFFLGYMYREGKGTEKDTKKGSENLDRACDLGEYKACMLSAITYHNSGNYVKSLMLYKKAYSYGHYLAGTEIGHMYMEGVPGVPKNTKKAIVYLKPSCTQGMVSMACGILGTHYLQVKNYDMARQYLEKACNMKVDESISDTVSKNLIIGSCTNLGVLYAKGLGGKISMNKAKKYFKKSCNIGSDKGCDYYQRALRY